MREPSIVADEKCEPLRRLPSTVSAADPPGPFRYSTNTDENCGQSATGVLALPTRTPLTVSSSWLFGWRMSCATTVLPFIQLRTRRAPIVGAVSTHAQIASV